ncbi:cation-dependent mannose-6-phosphate receptor-like [Amphiura filiformis]|uniref:cation-dependent mannose-6-phosphate receptor-like n=1 Tax=Amphiura filiformis TaxID=82378 RepID=UPI003B2183C3
MEIFVSVSGRICLTLHVLFLFIGAVVGQDTCTMLTGSTCVCAFPDGTKIDLTPLAGTNKPGFDYKEPEGGGDYSYAYNPCTGFSDGGDLGTCSKVAACQRSKDLSHYYNIGNPSTAEFSGTGDLISYTGGEEGRQTDVQLICDKNTNTPKYVVEGQTGDKQYKLQVTSCHICRGGCPPGSGKKSLSFGSILCILFVVLVFVYLIGGIIFNRYARGASGKEVIPNVSLWEEFPLLVKDGFVFVASCCKSDSSYESI